MSGINSKKAHTDPRLFGGVIPKTLWITRPAKVTSCAPIDNRLQSTRLRKLEKKGFPTVIHQNSPLECTFTATLPSSLKPRRSEIGRESAQANTCVGSDQREVATQPAGSHRSEPRDSRTPHASTTFRFYNWVMYGIKNTRLKMLTREP